LLNGATKLNYNLYSDAAHTTVWGSYLWRFAQTPPTINISLNGGGSGSTTSTIYAQVSADQQTLPTGTYTSSFSGTNTQISYAQSTVGTCAAIGATNATAAPFTVTATYPATCAISATTLNFGTVGVLTAAVGGRPRSAVPTELEGAWSACR
jgi:spore coat protein U-like protein